MSEIRHNFRVPTLYLLNTGANNVMHLLYFVWAFLRMRGGFYNDPKFQKILTIEKLKSSEKEVKQNSFPKEKDILIF